MSLTAQLLNLCFASATVFESEGVYSLILFLLIVLIARSWILYREGRRVEAAVASRLGRLVCRGWDPQGGGWNGSRRRRIYRIVYADRDGGIHLARAAIADANWVRFYDLEAIGRTPSRGGIE